MNMDRSTGAVNLRWIWRRDRRDGKMAPMPLARRPSSKGPGRPSGAEPGRSRANILAAARELFGKVGFLQTTTRAIASKAGVDSALVHYFFKTKEKLFSEAVELPLTPEELKAAIDEVAAGDGRAKGRGERLVRFMLEKVFTSRSHAVAAIIRAAVADPGSVPALRSMIEKTVVTGAASAVHGPDARLRAELLGAMMVGLFVVRHVVRVDPLASASPETVAKWLGPAVDQVLGWR
jgi:AcrR family transcriptional regulator